MDIPNPLDTKWSKNGPRMTVLCFDFDFGSAVIKL